jgi:hypothetical protein
VTLKLQDQKISLLEVRILFDYVILKYPTMNRYLASDASIVTNPNFENGIVKIQKKEPFVILNCKH